MNLVNISVYGEGYYSGSSYEESIFLLEEDYKELGKDLDGIEVHLGELDGKHSEVYGAVYVEIITEEMQKTYNFNKNNDGEELYDLIEELSPNSKNMIERAKKYIETLDSLVDITFTVKKSQVEKIKEVVLELIK